MAELKVTDTELRTVANSIREITESNGTEENSLLKWPTDYIADLEDAKDLIDNLKSHAFKTYTVTEDRTGDYVISYLEELERSVSPELNEKVIYVATTVYQGTNSLLCCPLDNGTVYFCMLFFQDNTTLNYRYYPRSYPLHSDEKLLAGTELIRVVIKYEKE